MKNLLTKIGLIIFIGLLISTMFCYNSWMNCKEKYQVLEQENEQLITKFDSIMKIPPDTIKLPPEIIKKDSLIYVPKIIKEPTKEAKIYRDSLINDSIDVRLQIWAKELFKIEYQFKPIYKYQETIVEKKVPVPVEIIKTITVPQRGLWFEAGLGWSEEDIGAKIGLDYITRKNNGYGVELVRYNKQTIFFASYKIKL